MSAQLEQREPTIASTEPSILIDAPWEAEVRARRDTMMSEDTLLRGRMQAYLSSPTTAGKQEVLDTLSSISKSTAMRLQQSRLPSKFTEEEKYRQELNGMDSNTITWVATFRSNATQGDLEVLKALFARKWMWAHSDPQQEGEDSFDLAMTSRASGEPREPITSMAQLNEELEKLEEQDPRSGSHDIHPRRDH